MNTVKRNAFVAVALLIAAVSIVRADENKIDFLILVDQQASAVVGYRDGPRPRFHLFNPIGSLIDAKNSFVSGYKSGEYGEALNSKLDKFKEDRPGAFSSAILQQFERNTDVFAPDIRAMSSVPELVRSGKPDFKSLRQSEVRFVLMVTERFGLMTPELNPGELAPVMVYEVRFFDVKSKRRMFKEDLYAFHGMPMSPDAALANEDRLQAAYPELHKSLAYRLYSRLNGTNVLHHMAASGGLGSRVPPMADVLKEYAKAFDFEQPKLPGWRMQKTRNDYLFVLAPKKHKKNVAIVTDVDLMIDAFGQDVAEFSDYIFIRRGRLQDAGWNLDSHTDNETIEVGPGWISYTLDNPQGGKSIFFHMRVSQDFSLSHEIVVLGNDVDALVKLYEDDIVRYIAEARLLER